jgi:predicted TIM-barrel fold metal-dependent hydrolase
MIIDFHAHAFPDHLAERAITTLEEGCNVKAKYNGKISSLLQSMDNNNIDKTVICSIATKPNQFDPILEWSKSIRSDRIIPLPSIHPDNDNLKEKIKIIFKEGFKGIKLHPYYQEYILNAEKIFPVYEEMQKYGLLLVSHTGFDIAFPRDRIADPVKIIDVLKKFPELKFIATHFGAWKDWDEVEKHLISKPIYMEISFSLELLKSDQSERMLTNHPSDYLLFGTDSPWTDPKNTLNILNSLKIKDEIKNKILYKNACSLLEI